MKLSSIVLFSFAWTLLSQHNAAAELAPIEALTIHPVFSEKFMCSQHADGTLKGLGDALGSDCVIHQFVEENGRKWLRSYNDDGAKNEDWFGWGQDVLAPFDGLVEKINIASATNEPGILNCSVTPGYIIFLRDDGVRVVYAHVGSIFVEAGSRVTAGAVVANVGNNGCSRSPHIHIGAWQGTTPMDIRFDLRAMR